MLRDQLCASTSPSLRKQCVCKKQYDYIIMICKFSVTLKMTRWCELRTRKIPRRLFLNQTSIIVAENALEAYLSLTVACITPKNRTFWLIFQAKTGDFIIQVGAQ